METITITKEGLERIVNRLSCTTPVYKQEFINNLFNAQEAITNGTYKKDED